MKQWNMLEKGNKNYTMESAITKRKNMGKSNPFSCKHKIQMFKTAILGVNLSSKQIYFKYYP